MDGLSGLAGEILANRKNAFTFEKAGKTAHLNTRYIPELGWYLLVEQTEEKAIRHIFQALFINLSIWAVITIVVVFSLINLTIKIYQRKSWKRWPPRTS